MNNILKKELSSIGFLDTSFIDEARREAKAIKIEKSAWAKNTGFANEVLYKKVNAGRGRFMYHAHFCFRDWKQFEKDTEKLEGLLEKEHLILDRFGVSIDPSMALPQKLRKDKAAHTALYFKDQKDWNRLASKKFSQVHLGDNMIGSPASFDSCVHALKAGITTMGNISQFFGWDYEQFQDIQARAKGTIQAIAVMAEHKEDGALIHSNLDDGYGSNTKYIRELIGMAILEKYIVCDLLGARLAPSFGDDFHSPYKRMIMLSALNQLYHGNLTGSMLFTNKLGRDKNCISLNDAHLAECLLFDMVGQAHYRNGYAITVMADEGLSETVKPEEIVHKLALAKKLEDYIPEAAKLIDFDRIDETAADIVKEAEIFATTVLDAFSSYIDIHDPLAVMLGIKKTGIITLMSEFGMKNHEEISTDFNLFEH